MRSENADCKYSFPELVNQSQSSTVDGYSGDVSQRAPSLKNVRLDWRVIEALDFISHQGLAKLPSLSSIAAQLNISTSRLRQLFKSEAGISFDRFVKEKRLVRANYLLKHTGLTIKEVMVEVGINDRSHFTKDYVKRFQQKPSATKHLARTFNVGEILIAKVAIE
jgi:AraC-like DNA-binding protein